MQTTTALALLMPTFLFGAFPVLAQDMMPGVMGTTTMSQAMVDAKGMALYTYEKDASGKLMCNDDCAKEWPPLTAAADAKSSGDWTIVTRDDGTIMWASEGMPMYTFLDDKKAGDVMGDNKDGFHLAM